METLFALVLTSCLFNDKDEVVCEPFQVEIATTLELCEKKKKEETPFLLEMEKLECTPVTYKKD
ncbi:hypothetical protein 65p376 [Aeromonas phage 65]|uniref:Uncharacterized protein n=2 Tax=Ishigurovirus osborne TaxID=260149 RepID=A0A219YCK2_9CAUD|nr:hypothetical protein ST65p376 [Aeromonas phage 65]ADQ53384.1 hypothetical protein 65p376 [Aeromonas phage 65]APU01741.1 hypothetical protein [Aeromonas phage 65.2]